MYLFTQYILFELTSYALISFFDKKRTYFVNDGTVYNIVGIVQYVSGKETQQSFKLFVKLWSSTHSLKISVCNLYKILISQNNPYIVQIILKREKLTTTIFFQFCFIMIWLLIIWNSNIKWCRHHIRWQ